MGAPILPLSVTREGGDLGREYIIVTIGGVEITIYQSEVRPGGVTVEIDHDGQDVAVYMNDQQIFPEGGKW